MQKALYKKIVTKATNKYADSNERAVFNKKKNNRALRRTPKLTKFLTDLPL